jgi:DNA replication protein DnaC
MKEKHKDFLFYLEFVVGKEHIHQTFSTFKAVPNAQGDDTHSKIVAESVAENPFASYLFFGESGTGKNHLASAIAQCVVMAELETGKLSCPKIVNTTPFKISESVRGAMDRGGKKSIIDDCKASKLLVLNEIGRSKASEFEGNVLFDLLDYRFELKKQTILISGMALEDLQKLFGVALYDRIHSECVVKYFDWESYRKPTK